MQRTIWREIVVLLLPASTLLAAVGGPGSVAPRGVQDDAAQVRAAFLRAIDRPRVPLTPTVSGSTVRDGVLEERVSFFAEAGQPVPALIIKPRNGAGRRPAVISLHGTGGTKESQAGRLRELAARGFVGVAIDGRYHGERAPRIEGPLSPYEDAILRAFKTGRERPFLYDTVWDVMRTLDYLQSRDDVDPARIGLMGISKGGMETYLAAAVDPRIAAAVPVIGVQSFRWALDHGAWDSRAWTLRGAVEAAATGAGERIGAPFMRKFYERVAPGVHDRFDGPAMLPLVAPRPLLVINGDSDPRTPIAGVRACLAAARPVYDRLGAAERLVLHLQPDTGHEVTPAAERAAADWFVRWLKPASN